MVRQSRIFLEIGCGAQPVPVVAEREFIGNDSYLGIDPHTQALFGLNGAEEKVSQSKPDENIKFMPSTASRVDLPDESVDEVYMANVIGDPSIEGERLARLRRERNKAWNSADDSSPRPKLITAEDLIVLPNILREAHRLLRQSGRLTILETSTPPDLSWMTDLLRIGGFVRLDRVTSRSPRWEETIKPYYKNPPQSWWHNSPNITFAQKK